jgi:hypothetical protein
LRLGETEPFMRRGFGQEDCVFQGGLGGGLDVGGLIRSRAAVRWVWVWVWVLAWIRMKREERRGRDEDDERAKRRMD